MCQMYSIHTPLWVLLRARRAERLEGRYLGIGLLANSDVVIVPEPPPELTDGSQELEVVVCPRPPDPTVLIERLGFCGLTTYVVGDGAPTIAVLSLAGHSRYASQIGECDPDRLAAALDDGRDFCAALAAAGAIDASSCDVPEPEMLRRMEEAEATQRKPQAKRRRLGSNQELAMATCTIDPKTCLCKK
jgi:hypothetical protein